jgi:hypothetical protein
MSLGRFEFRTVTFSSYVSRCAVKDEPLARVLAGAGIWSLGNHPFRLDMIALSTTSKPHEIA